MTDPIQSPAPSPTPTKPNWRFRIGLFLLIINSPFGWAGLALCTAMFAKTRNIWWEITGVGIYAISWGMLGLGVLMTGPEGVALARNINQKIKARFRKSPPPEKP